MRTLVSTLLIAAGLATADRATADVIRMLPDPVNTGDAFTGEGKVHFSFTEIVLLEGETLPDGGSMLRFGFEAQWIERRSLDNLMIVLGPTTECFPRCVRSVSLEQVRPEGFWRLEDGEFGGIYPVVRPGSALGLLENPRGELVYELAFVPARMVAGCDVCVSIDALLIVPEVRASALLIAALLGWGCFRRGRSGDTAPWTLG